VAALPVDAFSNASSAKSRPCATARALGPYDRENLQA
jgi:hypothetical protein